MTTNLTAWLTICSLFAVTAGADDSRTAAESQVETATFSMYCYWTGEATVGRVDGVVASRIGHWRGKEIVQVDYDPRRTGVSELTAALKKQDSFYSRLSLGSDEPHFIDPKHSLRTRHPELLALDLSEQQAIALNSWSYFGGDMPDVLTEEQKRRLQGR